MPKISTPSKIAATRSHGADVIFSGSTSEEREAVLQQVIKDTGARFVPPYDHPDIIAGQGTAGLEFQEQIRDFGVTHLDALVSPVGGGGLLGGLCLAFQSTGTKVFGAEPEFEGCNDAERGLAMDPPQRITSVKSLSIADGLRTPLGELNWTIISDKRLLQGAYSVSETQIKGAMRLLMERMKVFVEPSAVVGLAVVLGNTKWREEMRVLMGDKKEWNVGIVLTGGNTTMEAIAKIFSSDD
jgi:threonine dehydratase